MLERKRQLFKTTYHLGWLFVLLMALAKEAQCGAEEGGKLEKASEELNRWAGKRKIRSRKAHSLLLVFTK